MTAVLASGQNAKVRQASGQSLPLRHPALELIKYGPGRHAQRITVAERLGYRGKASGLLVLDLDNVDPPYCVNVQLVWSLDVVVLATAPNKWGRVRKSEDLRGKGKRRLDVTFAPTVWLNVGMTSCPRALYVRVMKGYRPVFLCLEHWRCLHLASRIFRVVLEDGLHLTARDTSAALALLRRIVAVLWKMTRG